MILIIQIVIGVIIGEALWSIFEMIRDNVIMPKFRKREEVNEIKIKDTE